MKEVSLDPQRRMFIKFLFFYLSTICLKVTSLLSLSLFHILHSCFINWINTTQWCTGPGHRSKFASTSKQRKKERDASELVNMLNILSVKPSLFEFRSGKKSVFYASSLSCPKWGTKEWLTGEAASVDALCPRCNRQLASLSFSLSFFSSNSLTIKVTSHLTRQNCKMQSDGC